jgi:hypothetical protein
VVDDQQEEGEYLLVDEGPTTVTNEVYIFKYLGILDTYKILLMIIFSILLTNRTEVTKVCSRKMRMKKIKFLLDISAMDVT